MTTTPPEQSTLVELIEQLRQGVIIIGFGPGDKEMVDVVTANQAMREAADILERLSSTEDGVTEAMIEAGATAFCETLSLDPRKLARVVYLAMLKARKGL